MSVRLAIIFFMHHAASLAFTKSEHMKCLGSEKLNFIGAEGAALFLEDDSMKRLLKKLKKGPDFNWECEWG